MLFMEARSFAAMTEDTMQDEHLLPLTDAELEASLQRVAEGIGKVRKVRPKAEVHRWAYGEAPKVEPECWEPVTYEELKRMLEA